MFKLKKLLGTGANFVKNIFFESRFALCLNYP